MIKLSENNLYSTGKIITFDDGSQELDRGDFSIVGTQNDFYLTPGENQRLDKIAWEQYSDLVPNAAKRWYVIALANDIENPLDEIEFIGIQIVIPNILDFKLRN